MTKPALKLSAKKYFVYQLSMDEAAQYVFYVGKGMGQRPHFHGTEAVRPVYSLKCAVIRHLFRRESNYWIRILHETDDEDEAYWLEMQTITSYPLHSLCNVIGGYRIKKIEAHIEQIQSRLWRGFLVDDFKEIAEVVGDTIKQTHEKLTRKYDNLVLPDYFKTIRYQT